MDNLLVPPLPREGEALPPIQKEWPIIAVDMPVMYEDEGQEEMGDSLPHYSSESILYYAIMAHLADREDLQVLPNMNLYFHPVDKAAYVSPDIMVVRPYTKLPGDLRSYRIGEHGPAPILTIEVLSRRTFQQGDLTLKPIIYADLNIPEYILVDTTGYYLEEKLRLRELDVDKTWINRQDRDGGVTSSLGFRIVIEDDFKVRVLDAKTHRKYLRPNEAETAETARLKAEERRVLSEKARERAEKARDRAEQAKRDAEQAKRDAEQAKREMADRLRELEAENERLRTQLPPDRRG